MVSAWCAGAISVQVMDRAPFFICSVGSCRAAGPRNLPSLVFMALAVRSAPHHLVRPCRQCSDPDPGARSSLPRPFLCELNLGRRPVLSARDGRPCRRVKSGCCGSPTTTTAAAPWPTWPPGTSARPRSTAAALRRPAPSRSWPWSPTGQALPNAVMIHTPVHASWVNQAGLDDSVWFTRTEAAFVG
jgi:hypothetical protein